MKKETFPFAYVFSLFCGLTNLHPFSFRTVNVQLRMFSSLHGLHFVK